MTVLTRSATSVDVFAGQRLRAFRINAGLSQTAVGNHLGVTFQQVQKYEKGANRMGASRLAQLSSLLGVQPADFFDEIEDRSSKPRNRPLMIGTLQERRLITGFRQLTPTQRMVVTDLVGSMRRKKDD